MGTERFGVTFANVPPYDLREALAAAFVFRSRVRWNAGTSTLLGVEYALGTVSGSAIDVRNVRDFYTIRSDRFGLSIGAFVAAQTLASDAELSAALGADAIGAAATRFRLTALGAKIVIAGPGATRTTALEKFDAALLPPYEIPLAVTLSANAPAVCFGDRRIKRADGLASFELRVYVALLMAGAHRIERATVAYAVDGQSPEPMPAVVAQLNQTIVTKATFPAAARSGADAFPGDDERTNTLRRTIIPLLLSALGDAYTAARDATP